VTAVDGAGNESLPSNDFYLNFNLLPVTDLMVVQEDTSVPVITWSHPGGDVSGYNIYLGSEETGIKLNGTLLTVRSYSDGGWSGDERTYTVVSVDSNGQRSPGRRITLPVIRTSLPEEARIRRGVMNRLSYTVENGSASRLEAVQLQVKAGTYNHGVKKGSNLCS